ncbi:DNA processing protein [Catenulispora sp. GP43]|uniref:DNA-processing protein DprA n=1 Tax=Catenulispora sp. GP43 TaxID=3156263 RepID=UPI003513414C
MQTELQRSIYLSLVAFHAARTPTRIDELLRTQGRAGLEALTEEVDASDAAALHTAANKLAESRIYPVMRGDANYPDRLIYRDRTSSPILYCMGNLNLLNHDGVGMCGSRSATELGLRAAAECGEEASLKNLTVISGYAKGVDTATHLAALNSGGSTVIVLAEGFDHFRIKSSFKGQFDLSRILVISQFPPSQPWLAHAAMTRNKIIFGLGRALVVVEAGERGGTLAAGEGALRMGRQVFVLNFGPDTPPGNVTLLKKGGVAVRSREELGRMLESSPAESDWYTEALF